ncbi:RHOMBOID-like protein 9, chloroplastic [Vicia villosa]|uniref:RHOMBOID-like protein 9, chloroplastic n=1 Tax=Vicia villosa TaxID=3911 RepID=UPI00273AA232|nr:RHOMBOID-like protein 9, chloroplastic [Vicia villosa]XP_058751265.1 RHOMBOID-like protein 9, chloroplastic [Vicia villosa]
MAAFAVCYRTPYKNTCIVLGRDSLHKNAAKLRVQCSSESSSVKKKLRSLDSYFGKLKHDTKLHDSDTSNEVMKVQQGNGLESLDEYLGKLNNGINQESLVASYVENLKDESLAPKQVLSQDTQRTTNFRKPNTYMNIRRIKGVSGSVSAIDSQQINDTSSLYLIGILASVNIAVFLFEIASPVRSNDLELLSLPSLYGAKINDLIMVGEWWRLITPMFLHAGILHLGLSCWALVSFGPQVCKSYGSLTFFLIYILGGVSGNIASFLHTPDPTVGGTGPVFAIIGAWLIYQFQNRDVIANDDSENLFKKAMIITALGFILCNLGPVDEWSHTGATFTGMVYGFLTSSTLQLDDTSPQTSGKGLELVKKYGGSFKSVIIFAISIVVLSSLLLFTDPPLDALASVDEAAVVALEYMSIFC